MYPTIKNMSTNQQKKKQKERDIRELPIAFKSCLEGGWEHHKVSSTEQKSSIIYEVEFEQIFLTSSYVDTQKEMARKITARLSALGEPVTKESIFRCKWCNFWSLQLATSSRSLHLIIISVFRFLIFIVYHSSI